LTADLWLVFGAGKRVRQVRISAGMLIKMTGASGYIPQCPRENFEVVLQLGWGPG